MTIIGSYVQPTPHGNEADTMQIFEAHFDAHETATQQPTACMNAFLSDNGKGWNAMVEQSDWTAWSWALSNRCDHVTPVIGVPMVCAGDVVPDIYYDIAGGVHDQKLRALAKVWLDAGYPRCYFRIGWEFNGSWYAWNAIILDDAGLAAWRNAWAHIARVLKSVPGLDAVTVWNPCAITWMPRPLQDYWPGDEFVDIVGLDWYSTCYPHPSGDGYYDWARNDWTLLPLDQWVQDPINRKHYWQYPGSTGWQPLHNDNAVGTVLIREFATAHHKQIALCECGTGINPAMPEQGINDDDVFVRFLAEEFPDLDHLCVWDTNVSDGHWQFHSEPSQQPKACAAWREVLAKMSSAPPVQHPQALGPLVFPSTLATSDPRHRGEVFLQGNQLWASTGE